MYCPGCAYSKGGISGLAARRCRPWPWARPRSRTASRRSRTAGPGTSSGTSPAPLPTDTPRGSFCAPRGTTRTSAGAHQPRSSRQSLGPTPCPRTALPCSRRPTSPCSAGAAPRSRRAPAGTRASAPRGTRPTPAGSQRSCAP
eukprot:3864561-Rhodomonas_salina.2